MQRRNIDPLRQSEPEPSIRIWDDVPPARWEGSAAILFDEFLEPAPVRPRRAASKRVASASTRSEERS